MHLILVGLILRLFVQSCSRDGRMQSVSPTLFLERSCQMNRFANCLILVALTAALGFSQESDRSSNETEERSETFYQQVEIQRLPRFSLQGMFIQQQIRYRILSTFELHAPDSKGHRIAKQTISDTALIEADPLSKATFEQSLIAMRGLTITYELDKFSRVVSMDDQPDNTKTIEVDSPNSKGMLITNVIDKDGWRELAELTLFQPPTGRSNRTFARKTTHDWGALGSWYGKTDFISKAGGRNRRRFSYKHDLEYRPPDVKADAQPNPLPFTINQANFRTYEASGEILYDTKDKFVTFVREVFHAKGSISLLEAATKVDLEERQVFTIEVTRQRTLRIPESANGSGER